MTLTDAGGSPPRARVLTDLTEVVNGIAEVEGLQRGHVGIGATPSLSATLLPTVLGRFHANYPGVSLTVSEQGSTHLMEGLESGELDIALVVVLPVHQPFFERTVLAIEELVVVIPTDHPLASLRRIGTPHSPTCQWSCSGTAMTCEQPRSAPLAKLVAPRVAVEGGEMGSVISLSAEGFGAAIIPSIVRIIDPRLHVLRLQRPALRREIALVRRRDRQLSRAASARNRNHYLAEAPRVAPTCSVRM